MRNGQLPSTTPATTITPTTTTPTPMTTTTHSAAISARYPTWCRSATSVSKSPDRCIPMHPRSRAALLSWCPLAEHDVDETATVDARAQQTPPEPKGLLRHDDRWHPDRLHEHGVAGNPCSEHRGTDRSADAITLGRPDTSSGRKAVKDESQDVQSRKK